LIENTLHHHRPKALHPAWNALFVCFLFVVVCSLARTGALHLYVATGSGMTQEVLVALSKNKQTKTKQTKKRTKQQEETLPAFWKACRNFLIKKKSGSIS